MATVILQARTGSSRLPGKALKTILGKPMLWYTVETLKQSPGIDRIVLAIPDHPRDDVLVTFAEEAGIDLYRGSENHVLERFYQASLVFKDHYYFRATGDNPILDYQNPGRSLKFLKEKGMDYVSESKMPLGTIIEAFTFEALERAYKEGSSAEDIEHVTWYIKKSGKFKTAFFDAPIELQLPGFRLTVDYPEDFAQVKEIIEALYKENIPPFKEIVAYIKKNYLNLNA